MNDQYRSGIALFTASIALLGSAYGLDPMQDTITAPYDTADQTLAMAPFGDAVTRNIVNYTRAAPYVGIAGRLNPAGVSEAKALGFHLLIDLRGPDEPGVAQEERLAADIGIAYRRLPLKSGEGAWEQVAAVETALNDPSSYPILLHCGSANRAAAVWTLYRHRQGVPTMIALEEGRAAGLTSREAQVRTLLDLPQADQ